MYYLKACGKCKGDMFIERDPYGTYLKCLQCARIVEVDITRFSKDRLAARLPGNPDKLAA